MSAAMRVDKVSGLTIYRLDGENSPWASTMAMLPYLSSFGSLGIINSTVYAVLDDNNGIGMAALPAVRVLPPSHRRYSHVHR